MDELFISLLGDEMKAVMVIVVCGVVWLGLQIDTSQKKYLTYKDGVVQAVAVEQTSPPSDTRPSEFRRVPHEIQSTVCIDNRTRAHYRGMLITREETEHVLAQAGFVGEQIQIMTAISHAESGSDMNCIADESLTGSKWDVSYGLFQIRTLKNAPGSCRDKSLLVDDLQRQAVCAKEIWDGQGYRAWSVYLNGRYKKWMGVGW